MRLYLAQHGHAVDKQEDPTRPLSEAGMHDVRRIAQQLGDAGVQVARVWHSGKLRAEQTAVRLAKQVLPTGKPEQTDGIAPNDSVEEFVADIDVWQEDTLVIGHLPFMSRLVSLLLTGNPDQQSVQFTPGGVVCLERISPEHWILAWMLTSDLLKGGRA
ncbi:MAG: phosphohistidine phosphatase SixA [Gammaproteobacteria bacterium]